MNKFRTTHELLIKAAHLGRNVLLEGRYGIGKSSLILSVAQELGFSMKYFSAPTLDPFADLVGIPVPVLEAENKHVVYLRLDAINEAEILFFDELNRAPTKVLNAVFELVQFRSINGERLPKLRCVFAAINPPQGNSHVEELDPALLDRFHFYVQLEDGPDRDWFMQEFGEKIGTALLSWYETDLDGRVKGRLSNRRLEYLGRCAVDGVGLRFAVPPGSELPIHLLEARISGRPSILTIEDFVRCPKKFSEVVATDLDVAIRFSSLVPMMGAEQLAAVSEIIVALPPEILTTILNQHPLVLRTAYRELMRAGKTELADNFGMRLRHRLARKALQHDRATLQKA